MGFEKLKETKHKKKASPAELAPALPKGNGLAGHRVNHSAKVTIENFMLNIHLKYNVLIKFLGQTCQGYYLF